LSSLVHINPAVSEQFIVQLSAAYRYILDQKDFEWVKLTAELEFLGAYFLLLQIRFDQKIQLQQNININPEAYKLPPLTLQLLVENAVKHNKMSATEPLVIAIYNEGEKLFIKNNLNLRRPENSSTGLGLENIKSRYAFITGQPVQIKRTENSYTVCIPLVKI
jgi:LytS/YehU family sensor histidine kinase